jgi:surface antigen
MTDEVGGGAAAEIGADPRSIGSRPVHGRPRRENKGGQVARDLCLNTGGVLNALLGALVATALGWSPAAAEETADDLQHLRPLINQTLETEKSGVEIGWSNPATGHSGTLRVERTFYRDQQPCRAYLRTVERPGALVTRGIGCRVGRAQWEIEEESGTIEEESATATASSPARGAVSADTAAKQREAAETTAKDEADASECPDPAELATPDAGEPAPAPFAAFTLPARSEI